MAGSRRMQNKIMALWVTGWDTPSIARAVKRSEPYVADALGQVRDRVSRSTARHLRCLRDKHLRERQALRAQPVRVPAPASSYPALNYGIQAHSALRQRNEAIRSYRARGIPDVEIALSFGLTVPSVRRIGRAS